MKKENYKLIETSNWIFSIDLEKGKNILKNLKINKEEEKEIREKIKTFKGKDSELASFIENIKKNFEESSIWLWDFYEKIELYREKPKFTFEEIFQIKLKEWYTNSFWEDIISLDRNSTLNNVKDYIENELDWDLSKIESIINCVYKFDEYWNSIDSEIKEGKDYTEYFKRGTKEGIKDYKEKLKKEFELTNNPENWGWYILDFKASYNDIKKIFWEANFGKSWDWKVEYQWKLENNEWNIFSIYPRKEFREIPKDEIINYHIGWKDEVWANKINYLFQ